MMALTEDTEQMANTALLFSQTVLALIKAAGMVAENQIRMINNETPAYDEQSFATLIASSGIEHDNATRILQKGQ